MNKLFTNQKISTKNLFSKTLKITTMFVIHFLRAASNISGEKVFYAKILEIKFYLRNHGKWGS